MIKALTFLIDNGGDKLFTIIYPNRDVETVILLHGGPGFPDDLTNIAESLSEKYQVITFHQRGTGKSPCKSRDYSMDAYISDINSVSTFFEIKKFQLIGHSWGGLYAQIYAQNHPEKLLGLFLCCPGSGTGAEWKQTEREVLRYNRSKSSSIEWIKLGINSLLGILGSDHACKRLFSQVVRNYNKEFLIKDQFSPGLNEVRAASMNKTRNEILKYPILKVFRHPGFRITIVYGDHDIYGISKEYVINRYPTARLCVIEHCGHFPWLHNPSKFSEALCNHFAQ